MTVLSPTGFAVTRSWAMLSRILSSLFFPISSLTFSLYSFRALSLSEYNAASAAFLLELTLFAPIMHAIEVAPIIAGGIKTFQVTRITSFPEISHCRLYRSSSTIVQACMVARPVRRAVPRTPAQPRLVRITGLFFTINSSALFSPFCTPLKSIISFFSF